jgi:hypothetical protein
MRDRFYELRDDLSSISIVSLMNCPGRQGGCLYHLRVLWEESPIFAIHDLLLRLLYD